jgi:hypothetical protein
MGRVVGRGLQAAAALATVVIGLTWLNRVAAAVMSAGGSCSTGGPYEVATPCPDGVWMAPVGLLLGLAGLALYLWCRPHGGPQLLWLAWPALFGSLGVQFLRAAAAEPDAYGFWLCGVVFVAMAVAPLALALGDDRRAVVRSLVGHGEHEPAAAGRTPSPSTADGPRVVVTPAPGLEVTLVPVDGDDDLAHRLERLARLHRAGELTDAEYSEAKHQVLERS